MIISLQLNQKMCLSFRLLVKTEPINFNGSTLCTCFPIIQIGQKVLVLAIHKHNSQK